MLSTLDTITSIVIVILVLSLIVQSIQSVIKKLLKLKSNVVFDSMQDLFKYIDTERLVGKTPQQLVNEVTEEFKKLGRVSLIRKNPMLDSIAKGDLQKILEKLYGDKLKPHIENWFDTTMQGFDERYTRHMKTVALVISFLVVILLNANFFNIYTRIANSESVRAEILAKGPEIVKLAEAANKAAETAQPTPQPSPSPAQTPPPTATTPADSAAAATKSREELANEIKALRGLVKQSEDLGLSPLTPTHARDFWYGTGGWENRNRFTGGIKVLLGWTIMALLLSVGAPFWQDTLESLFGVKNLLRKKSDTKNVEDTKGGQPKSD
ncbi:MAG TPA: hypothetical protein VFZ40_00740 [Pyrinomonadaceae bacterium]